MINQSRNGEFAGLMYAGMCYALELFFLLLARFDERQLQDFYYLFIESTSNRAAREGCFQSSTTRKSGHSVMMSAGPLSGEKNER